MTAPEAGPRHRRSALAVARIVLAALVVVAVVVAGWRNWTDVSGHLRAMSPGALTLSLLLGMIAPLATMAGWRVILADLGTRLAVPPAAGIYFVGQLGKFLPGSVWSVLAQAEMGARLGIARRRTAVVGLIAVALSLVTGLAVGLPALPLLLRREDSRVLGVAALLVMLLLLVALHPRVLNRVIAQGLRRLRRDPLEHDLTGRAIALTTAWFLVAWLAAGASVAVLVPQLAPSVSGGDLLLVSLCGFALASAGGMIAVVVPAGVGVRDGLLVLLLHTVMPLSAATAVAVLIRFITTLADVIWALIGWSWARAHHLLGARA